MWTKNHTTHLSLTYLLRCLGWCFDKCFVMFLSLRSLELRRSVLVRGLEVLHRCKLIRKSSPLKVSFGQVQTSHVLVVTILDWFLRVPRILTEDLRPVCQNYWNELRTEVIKNLDWSTSWITGKSTPLVWWITPSQLVITVTFFPYFRDKSMWNHPRPPCSGSFVTCLFLFSEVLSLTLNHHRILQPRCRPQSSVSTLSVPDRTDACLHVSWDATHPLTLVRLRGALFVRPRMLPDIVPDTEWRTQSRIEL